MRAMKGARPKPLKDVPSLRRTAPFDWERLLTRVEPGPAEETEAFVRHIYEQRRLDRTPQREQPARR